MNPYDLKWSQESNCRTQTCACRWLGDTPCKQGNEFVQQTQEYEEAVGTRLSRRNRGSRSCYHSLFSFIYEVHCTVPWNCSDNFLPNSSQLMRVCKLLVEEDATKVSSHEDWSTAAYNMIIVPRVFLYGLKSSIPIKAQVKFSSDPPLKDNKCFSIRRNPSDQS